MPHMPIRRCRVCRVTRSKAELKRWTLTDGRLKQDEAKTAPGRGYYSCSERCSEILPMKFKSKKE